MSHESLSRRRTPEGAFDGIVVDESHRFRPTSRRHATLATLAARAPILLLSATPLQNRERELAAQLALFLGEGAYRLDAAALTQWVVRTTPAELGLPRVAPARWVPIHADDGDVLRAILALPPPPRAADAGDGGALVQLSLVRAWASSRAALTATVRRRRRTLAALEQCHHAGRLPTRRELRSWQLGDDVQLGFPALLASSVVERAAAGQLARAIEREGAALDALVQTLATSDDPDRARVDALRALRDAHPGASILAFSEWASTVRAYWAALRVDPGVGLLTANEARIASGRVSRAELLGRFAPRAQGTATPRARDRVTLLLATDLLAEGVNLQDASVVVHLDLPWNPARLAQRVGRLRRPGGASEIASYLVSPPARAALLLRAESRLRAKLARMERTIGRGIDVLPAFGADAGSMLGASGDRARCASTVRSSAELRGEIARQLARWRDEQSPPRARVDGFVCASVRADVSGWVALLDDGRLLATVRSGDAGDAPSELPNVVAAALALSVGASRTAPCAERDAALRALDEWIERDWGRRSCGLAVADTPMRRRVLRAVDETLRGVPRHRRAAVGEWAARVRRALAAPLPLGLERALDALLLEPPTTESHWLERAATLVASAPVAAHGNVAAERPRVAALILFAPGDEAPSYRD